jgi:hypothetical protein
VTQPDPAGSVVDGVDIDAVHTAVTACPGVARVGSGALGALTTYLPGRRIPGIRINPDSVEVEVVAEWEAVAGDIGRCVRSAVTSLARGRRVDITIADIDLPGEHAAEETGIPQPAQLPPAPVRPELPAAPIYPPVVVPSESEL